tara:strand:- start:143 stop:670 length:528 start_codon:yes stop_codon:yes gene_type:complete
LNEVQKKILANEKINEKKHIKHHLEKIISSEILKQKGILNNKKDVLIEKTLYNTQVNYLLDCSDDTHYKAINKYNIANYYFLLAKQYNRIALNRKISRNKLWNIIKKNIIIKDYNNTQQRLYKYIFRGEIIPSIKFVENSLNTNDDLISYLSIIYLDEIITPELGEAYQKLKDTK